MPMEKNLCTCSLDDRRVGWFVWNGLGYDSLRRVGRYPYCARDGTIHQPTPHTKPHACQPASSGVCIHASMPARTYLPAVDGEEGVADHLAPDAEFHRA